MIGEMPEEGDITRIGWSWSRWRGEGRGGGEQERRDDGAHATTTARHRDTIGALLAVELCTRRAERRSDNTTHVSGAFHRQVVVVHGWAAQNPEGGAAL